MSDQIVTCEIKKFSEFLDKCLNRKVIGYTMKPLTKAGDNYGSVLHSVELEVTGSGCCDKTETLYLVSKTSVVDPSYVQVFQPAITFVKENRFYSDIIPAIKYFEEISNVPDADRVDAFFKCFGSRISLGPDAVVADIDALLILENVKIHNYTIGDRLVGFNTTETVAILESLAQLHALCIAIRCLQPELFNSKLSPYLNAVNLNLDDNDFRMMDSVRKELHFLDELDSELRTKIEKYLKVGDDFSRDTNRTADTPYTTLVHRDLWINNIMIKKDSNMSMKIKMYDFQLYFYQSFVHDLIFFLFTSVRPNDLKENFHSFINYYHIVFTRTLKLVGMPMKDYTFEKMWQEIQERAKNELLHVLFMIKVTIFDPTIFNDLNTDITPDTFFNWKQLPKNIRTRWELVIEIFSENGFF